jgi:ornithine cyclodeaminase/alanine dehydrogenase-like protein (mu-crystallin family)
MNTTRILTQRCLAEIVTAIGLDPLLDDLIERLADAFSKYDPATVETMARDGFRYTKPDLGLIEWMPTMVLGSRVAIKTVGYHPTNPVERNVPSVLATTSLHDTVDGRLLALCDSTFLTALRTGAASAVVTDVLAIESASTLGMIGCGAQAVTQIHAISRVRPIERIVAFDADATVAESLAARLLNAGVCLDVEVVEHASVAVCEADVLCTATSVDPDAGPVFEDGPYQPWLHVNAVGADLPGKFELPDGLLAAAVVVPDHLEQCLVEGEAQRLEASALGPDLAALLRHRDQHTAMRGVTTVFDSTGWALEDLIAAELMLQHAERMDVGFAIDLQPNPSDPYDPYELLWT